MPLIVTATRSAHAAPLNASIKAAFTAKKHAREGVLGARQDILMGGQEPWRVDMDLDCIQ
jgi:hypothetical protein